jgi:hypothetical protein
LVFYDLVKNFGHARDRCDQFVSHTFAKEVEHIIFTFPFHALLYIIEVFERDYLANLVVVIEVVNLQQEDFVLLQLVCIG